jgi:HEAT repeat protein
MNPHHGPNIVMKKTILFTITFLLILSQGFSLVYGQARSDEQVLDDILSDDPSKVSSGIEYIKAHRPPSMIRKLESLLTARGNNGQHKSALSALSSYPASSIMPNWIEILSNTHSSIVKREVISILSQVNSRDIVPPLMEQIKDPFHTVRESAILALKKFRDDRVYAYILNLAASEIPVYKIYSLEAIYHLYDTRLYNFLVDQLRDDNKSVRYYSLMCLEKNELAKSVNYISRIALSDKNSEVRVKAIDILSGYRPYNPLSIFLRCVDDPHRDIRHAAISAIARRKFTSTSGVLSNQLYGETQEDIKNLIMDTLVEFRDGGGFRGLAKILLEDGNPALRINAAFSIGEIKSARSLPQLMDGLKDADYRVKAEVCHSLRNFRENRVVDSLIDVIAKDTNPYVRTAALYSINHIRLRNGVLPLFNAYTVERDVIFRELLRKSVSASISHFVQ